MKNAENAVNWLSEMMAILATIVLVMMMLMTVSDVLLRTFFSETILGVLELTEMMMTVIGYLGIAWCALQGGHVAVDILVSSLSESKQRLFDVFNYLLAIFMTFMIGWTTYKQGLFVKQINILTDNLDIPKYIFYMITSFGFFLMTAAVLILLAKTMKRTVEK